MLVGQVLKPPVRVQMSEQLDRGSAKVADPVVNQPRPRVQQMERFLDHTSWF